MPIPQPSFAVTDARSAETRSKAQPEGQGRDQRRTVAQDTTPVDAKKKD